MGRDGSLAEAARYLGITPDALQSATVTIRAWQKKPGNAEAYQAALHHIAEIASRANAGGEPAAEFGMVKRIRRNTGGES
jgi:hypothetical protein